MASTLTLLSKILNVKNTVVTGYDYYEDTDGVSHLSVMVRPNKCHENDCPICHRHCPRYDAQGSQSRHWRELDWGGILVEVIGETHRIQCPEHGVLVADVPWAYPGSSFTKKFDLTVAWLAVSLPKSTVSEYMRIDWETVGRCIHRTLHEIEPDRASRLNGLVHIGIDETSYKKGHKYMTIVVNLDTNTVVWIGRGYGKAVLEKFFQQLSIDQLSTIEVVTGDGARWITDCVNQYVPNSVRCVDNFHVVEWANEALDAVRREAWQEAHKEATQLAQDHPQKRGRPKTEDKAAAAIADAKAKASSIKNSRYVLGKAPENLTENQQVKLEMIAVCNPRLYRAYLLKEQLRLILKLHDPVEAEAQLKQWLWRASHSQIPAFKELYQKVKRHKEHILNSIKLGLSNARVEAINTKIKLLLRKARGFRNIENMFDLIYLVCSDLRIPLPNRKL